MQSKIDLRPNQTIVFIGDSIIQGLYVSAVTENGVNFGISGDTTAGVLERIDKYTILNKARAVVIAIGINDIPRRNNKKIIENLLLFVKVVKNVVIVFINISKWFDLFFY